MEEWREFLYPLGFLATIPFTARFLLQWILSERKGKSVAPKSFWVLSLVGNIALAIHSCLQIQYIILLVQTCNAVISWRNMNLLQSSATQWKFRTVLGLFLLMVGLASILFFAQFAFSGEQISFFRNPGFFYGSTPASYFWHFIGTLGILLFTSRFWLQWWESEKQKTSLFTIHFWTLSILGAFLSVIYFLKIGDPVNAIGPACGLIPYIRNVFLIKRTLRSTA